MTTDRRHSSLSIWLLIAAAGLMLLPEEMQAKCRLLIGDLVKPGCLAWRGIHRQVVVAWRPTKATAADTDPEVQRLRDELASANIRVRQLEVQYARIQEEAAAHRPPLFASSDEQRPTRLALPVLIDAAVLGAGHTSLWRKGRWLEQGKAAGLMEEAPILASANPLLDLGRDAQLSPEDGLLLGRSVIGKVAQVGRWTSTFLLVTDAEYRGRAQLVRETADGYVFGAKGVLKGQTDATCVLEGVPAEDSVDVGDSVYTADRDGLLPTPLYYGQVVEATLLDRAREWRIVVQPAELPQDLTHVQVLRSALNPRRVMGN